MSSGFDPTRGVTKDRAAALKQAVLDEVRRGPAPTRASESRRGRALAFVAAAIIVALSLKTGVPAPSPARPGSYLAFAVVVPLACVVLAWVSARAGRPDSLGPGRSSLVALAFGIPVALATLPLVAVPSPVPDDARVLFACLVLHAATTAAVLSLGLVWYRGKVPVLPALAGGALGAVAFAWATVATTLRCGIATPLHVLSAHVAPVAVVVALAAWAGARWLPPRRVVR